MSNLSRIYFCSVRPVSLIAAFPMAKTGVLFPIVGIIIVLHAIGASPMSHWYCHRLVPPSITSSVTPCMYPCLFISPYEQPHIVVHPEFDGTACKIESGLHQNTQIGKCRSGVCTRESGAKVLKRKKRFICLLTLAHMIKAKRDRRKLRGELEQLKKYVLLSNYARSGRLGIGGALTGNLQGGRIHGAENQGHNTGGPSALELHIVTHGRNGAAVPGSSAGIPRTSNSENSFNNGAGGLNALRTGFSSEGTGRARDVDANLASVNISEAGSSRTTSSVAGIGESIPGIVEVGNSGDGSNGAGARINPISPGTAATFGGGAGGSSLGLGSRFGGGSAGNGFGGESGDETVGGDNGVSLGYHGSGIREIGPRAGLLGGRGAVSGRGMRIGGGVVGATTTLSSNGGSAGESASSSGTASRSSIGNVGFANTMESGDEFRNSGMNTAGFTARGYNFGGGE